MTGREAFRTVAGLWLLAGWAGMATAQTSDSATVDATATLAAAPLSLSIRSALSLRFGSVLRPSGGDVQTCSYHIDTRNNEAVFEDGVASTQFRNCGFQGSGRGNGRIVIDCEPSHVLAFTYSFDSPVAAQGAQFIVHDADIGFATVEGVPHSMACPAGGRIDLNYGGHLDVSRDVSVPEGSNVVGHITMDVYYEAQTCICD
ncbi:MAG: hypothetical protein ABW039_08140 [Sphingobium sp.]